jgi:hypothetical protein
MAPAQEHEEKYSIDEYVQQKGIHCGNNIPLTSRCVQS